MFKRKKFYSFYLYIMLLVISLPIGIMQKEDNEQMLNSFTLLQKPAQVALQENTNDEKNLKVAHASNERTHELADTLQRTFHEFEQLLANILDVTATNLPQISKEADIFLAKFSKSIRRVWNAFSNKVFKEQNNDLISEMLNNIEQQLELVSLEFENIAESIDEQLNLAVVQLNYTIINNTAEYDWWTAHIKHKIRTINDTKFYQQGCQAIEEFISFSSKELQSCCKITMKPVRSLCKSTSFLLRDALQTIMNIADRMQACLEDKNSYLDYMLPCINLAYDEIINLVSRAVKFAQQINDMLPMKLIFTRSCFAIVKVEK